MSGLDFEHFKWGYKTVKYDPSEIANDIKMPATIVSDSSCLILH